MVGPLLTVSFQRYPRPVDGVLISPPTSFGALPIGVTFAGELCAPVDAAEALWLGVSTRRASIAVLVRVAVETTAQGELDAVSGSAWSEMSFSGYVVPPTQAIDGIARRGGGLWPFTRVLPAPDAPACTALQLIAIPPRRLACRQAGTGREPVSYHQPESTQGSEPGTDGVPKTTDAAFWREGRAVRVRIRLVDSPTFAADTGLPPPPPLDPTASYGGWRLP